MSLVTDFLSIFLFNVVLCLSLVNKSLDSTPANDCYTSTSADGLTMSRCEQSLICPHSVTCIHFLKITIVSISFTIVIINITIRSSSSASMNITVVAFKFTTIIINITICCSLYTLIYCKFGVLCPEPISWKSQNNHNTILHK